jgi:hypothetical protein
MKILPMALKYNIHHTGAPANNMIVPLIIRFLPNYRKRIVMKIVLQKETSIYVIYIQSQ